MSSCTHRTQAILQEFGVYLTEAPTATPFFDPPPWGTPWPSPSPGSPQPGIPLPAPAPQPLAPSPTPPPSPAPIPGIGASLFGNATTLYVAPQLLLQGAGVSTWNTSVQENILQPVLIAVWNATGLLQGLVYVNTGVGGAPSPSTRRRLLQGNSTQRVRFGFCVYD